MTNTKRGLYLTIGFGALMSGALFAETATNQSWGHADKFGVDAVKAWSLVKGKCADSGVVVAVIDTGIDMNHPDLKNSLWTNEKEAAGKPGVDNDGDGFVGDVHGWDFVTNSGNLVDVHGHGTPHCRNYRC